MIGSDVLMQQNPVELPATDGIEQAMQAIVGWVRVCGFTMIFMAAVQFYVFVIRKPRV